MQFNWFSDTIKTYNELKNKYPKCGDLLDNLIDQLEKRQEKKEEDKMKSKSERIFKKVKKGKISSDEVKIYLTPLGKIVAAGEAALREREEKNIKE